MHVAVTIALVAALATAGWFWLRLRTLGRRVGSFACAIQTASGWTSGIALYGASELRWYRVVSISPSARWVWSRQTFAITGPAEEIDADDASVPRGPRGRSSRRLVAVPVLVSPPGKPQEEQALTLAISASAYAGLASWLESAPPGLPSVLA